MRFNPARLGKVKAGRQRVIYWDSTRPGLGLRIEPTGARAYVFRYKIEGTQKLLTLGSFDDFNDAREAYDAAREDAARARAAVREGESPAALDPLESRRKRQRALHVAETCDELVAAYFADVAAMAKRDAGKQRGRRKVLRDSTLGSYRRLLHKHFLPDFGDVRAADIRDADLIVCLDRVARNSDANAEFTRNALGSLFRWAAAKRIIPPESNPTKGLPHYYAPVERDRVLGDDELAALFGVLNGDAISSGRHTRLALLFALATAARSGEVLAMRWADIDVGAQVWTIPATVSKTHKARRVPLSGLALDLVDELRAIKLATSKYVFPGDNPARPLQQQTLGTMLRRFFPRKAGKPQPRDGLAPFTAHDLRRTARTKLSALGVPELIGEMLLGHSGADKVARAYAHHSFEVEQRAALNKWGDWLIALRDGGPAAAAPPNVIPLHARKAG